MRHALIDANRRPVLRLDLNLGLTHAHALQERAFYLDAQDLQIAERLWLDAVASVAHASAKRANDGQEFFTARPWTIS